MRSPSAWRFRCRRSRPPPTRKAPWPRWEFAARWSDASARTPRPSSARSQRTSPRIRRPCCDRTPPRSCRPRRRTPRPRRGIRRGSTSGRCRGSGSNRGRRPAPARRRSRWRCHRRSPTRRSRGSQPASNPNRPLRHLPRWAIRSKPLRKPLPLTGFRTAAPWGWAPPTRRFRRSMPGRRPSPRRGRAAGSRREASPPPSASVACGRLRSLAAPCQNRRRPRRAAFGFRFSPV